MTCLLHVRKRHVHHHRQGEILLVCIPISQLLMFDIWFVRCSFAKDLCISFFMSAALTALLSCIGYMSRLPACMYMLPASLHRIAIGLALKDGSPCVSVICFQKPLFLHLYFLVTYHVIVILPIHLAHRYSDCNTRNGWNERVYENELNGKRW